MEEITAIYCDFDGTITKKDAVNTFFEMYADPDWLKYEDMWVAGKITSMENAIKQVALLPEISQKQLDDYINSIEVDDYFSEFIEYIKSKNIKFTILSDGFDLFINKTLERMGITDIPVYANKLIYKNNKFSIEFPYHDDNCDIGAGMCKCHRITEPKYCYIGDGTSDLCVAKKADFLFATKSLYKFCKANLIKNSHFESFRTIIDVLKSM